MNYYCRNIGLLLILIVSVTLAACGGGGDGGKDDTDSDINSSPGPNTAAEHDPPVVSIDPTILPAVSQIAGIDGGPQRNIDRMGTESGTQFDFVQNELYIITDDRSQVDSLLSRWNGTLNYEVDFTLVGMASEPSIYYVTIDPSTVDTSNIESDLKLVSEQFHGELTLSSENAKQLLAVIARERLENHLDIGLNVLLQSNDFSERITIEATMSSAPVDINGATPISRDRDALPYGYTSNTFEWPYLNRNTDTVRQYSLDTGVAEAWRVLEAANKLNNRVRVLIADGGFRPNADFPPVEQVIGNLRESNPDPLDCGSSSGRTESCNWHGTHVALSGFGVPNNQFGTAGPGGPVSDLILLQSPDVSMSSLIRYIFTDVIQAIGAMPRIVNVSATAELPAGACIIACGPLDTTSQIFDNSGSLFVAAAGNVATDVDATDEVCIFFGCIPFEETVHIPCELEGVFCVGALDWDSSAKASFSNYGSDHSDGGSVDIWAPGVVWSVNSAVAADSINTSPDDTLKVIKGTSFASPYIAGVASLIWAANPSLSDDDVRSILVETAHTDSWSGATVHRRVNALAAVQRALGGDTHPFIEIERPRDGRTILAGTQSFSVSALVEDLEDTMPLTVHWIASDGFSIHDLGFGENFPLNAGTLPAGSYTITATATDSAGHQSSDSVQLNVVNSQPTVTIDTPSDGATFTLSQSITFRGDSADANAQSGILDAADVHWESSTTVLGTGYSVTVSGSELGVGTHEICFYGTDGEFIAVDCINITINADPTNSPPSVRIITPETATNYLAEFTDASGDYAVITLDWEVTDPDADSLQIEWSYTRDNESEVVFVPDLVFIPFPSSQWISQVPLYPNTCGSTFVIRLTADDGVNPPVSDEVEINVIDLC